jgi:HD-like signal output (HDOD) protein
MRYKEECSFQVDILDLVRENPQLATLPEVYSEFKKAVEDPDLAFDRIEKIILKDPPLTARLLKIVNSAFYSLPREIATVTHAAGVIGTERLGYLVLSTVVMDKFKSIPDSIINMNSYWRHSIACGLGACRA